MKSRSELLLLFKKYLEGRGFKKYTVRQNEYSVTSFFEFAGINHPADVRQEDIRAFHKYLLTKESRFKKPYSESTIRTFLLCIKRFFRFLYRYEYILINPMSDYTLKKSILTKKAIFTSDEIDLFLNSINTDDIVGERNRAFFELMYSSGLRITEELNLDFTDMDLNQRLLTIRRGKGDKDRIVPFSEVALAFLKKYIKNARKKLVKLVRSDDKKALFLSRQGRLRGPTLRGYFKKYLEIAGIKRKGITIHSIRHSTGTHLLEAGASIRYVQELLGHENIETTVKYTHLMIENLKRAYKSAHPRENKYYEEITGDYIQKLTLLKEEIRRRRKINKKYPWRKYDKKE